MKEIKKVFILICLFLIISCQIETTRKNAPEDIKEAEVFVHKFYKAISENNKEKLHSFFSTQITPKEGEMLINKIKLLLGEIHKIKVKKVSTKIITKDNIIKKEYGFDIEAFYDSGKSFETINAATLYNSKEIKITGYSSQVKNFNHN